MGVVMEGVMECVMEGVMGVVMEGVMECVMGVVGVSEHVDSYVRPILKLVI